MPTDYLDNDLQIGIDAEHTYIINIIKRLRELIKA
jgi:hypothetical protein